MAVPSFSAPRHSPHWSGVATSSLASKTCVPLFPTRRCNREGKLPVGYTYVFEAEERPPAGLLLSAADTAKELRSLHPDPLAPAAVEAYFRHFYWTKKSEWDEHGVMKTMDIDRKRGRLLSSSARWLTPFA